MGQRLGRWQVVIMDALVERTTVGVRSLVQEHLGRPPTRAEIEAARRAARLLGESGRVRVGHIRVPLEQGGGVALTVSRLDPAPANQADEVGHLEEDPDVDRATAAVGTGSPLAEVGGHRLGRWQQVLVDALDEHDVVGLRPVVEGHLGRQPTRAESIAAQRAAHLLARRGRARLARVRAPTAKGRTGGVSLVIIRPGLAPVDLPGEAALRVIATRYVAPADRTREALETIVAALQAAAAQVTEVQLYTIDTRQAQQASQAMAVPLRQLTQLRQSLIVRR